MRAAHPPLTWPVDAQASAVLLAIQEVIHKIDNPRWRAATLAAFRVPADRYVGQEYDSLNRRFRALAAGEGYSAEGQLKNRVEAYRGYWIVAASFLADMVERRFHEIHQSINGWYEYRTKEPGMPPPSLPISFDRTDVLYQFKEDRGIRSVSYRWLTAHGPVDGYETVGWYYNEPDADVEIVPLANCTLEGPLKVLPQGGRCGSLKFGKTLQPGDQHFFAYETKFNSGQKCRPTILYEVRGLSMRSLTLRAQFDPSRVPVRLWRFDISGQSEGWHIPEDGSPEVIHVPSNGYIETFYPECIRGRKYGFRWQWE